MSSKLESRSFEQIKQHYEIEKILANRLKSAAADQRRYLYSSLYNELFRLVPNHPQLTQKQSADMKAQHVRQELRFLRRFLPGVNTFLEIGPGDCSLSLEMAKLVSRVYAVDVSDEITRDISPPDNFYLCISDGCSIPVPVSSVDLAYSDQLMEHLHPDDASEQLANIYTALNNGGEYLCITPHRFTGPRDVSQYFDDEATGFHLKEYTISELHRLFKDVGFSKVSTYVGGRGNYIKLPLTLVLLFEGIVGLLPTKFRKRVARFPLAKAMLGIYMVGTK